MATSGFIERRKKDEARLRLAAIVESSDDAILSKTLDGVITSWNPAAARLYGYGEEEMIGQSIDRIIPPDRQDEFETIMHEVRAGRAVSHLDTVRLRHDGSRLDVSITVSPLVDDDGKVTGASTIARDIGPGKAAAMALAASERKNRATEEQLRIADQVVQNIQLGINVLELEDPADLGSFRVIATNRAAAEVIGVPNDSVLGRTLRESFPRLLETEIPALCADVIRSGRAREIEDFYYGDDRIVPSYFSIRVFPLLDRRVGVVFENITERKRREMASIQAHERFEKAFNASPVALMIGRLTDDGVFAVNDAFERVFAWERDEILGRTTDDIGLYADSNEKDDLVQRLQDLGAVREFEMRCRTRSGTVLDILTSAEFIEIEGELLVLGAYVDVTERKRVERELRSRERQLSFLAHASAVLASSLDYETTLTQVANLAVPALGEWCAVHVVDDDGTVRELAVAHEDPAKLDVVRRLQERFPPNPQVDQGVYRVIRTGESSLLSTISEDFLAAIAVDEEHLELIRRLGFGSALVAALRTRDRSLGAISLVSSEPGRYGPSDLQLLEDLARRAATAIENSRLYQEARVAEHSMRALNLDLERRVADRTGELAAANERLGSVNRELESFAYSVSHDLRAPLRHADGFSRVLEKNYSSVLDERGVHYLHRIREATQRMGGLIDDLLQLSRVTRADLRVSNVDVSALATQVAAELQSEDQARQVEWVIAPGLTARGDERLLRVVFVNLLGNAWKFTRYTNHPRIEVGVEPTTRDAVYVIRDNGAGFDMAYGERLFSAFQRLHSSEEFEGTGVGLATVQRIVHRHGGSIWAHGVVGQGATISFTLRSPTGGI